MQKNKNKSIMGRVRKTVFTVILVLIFFSISQVVLFKYVDPPVTVNMLWERLLAKVNGTGHTPSAYFWKKLEKISPHLQQAVLASEDQRFLTHNGFDFTEMKIVIENIMATQRFRGASTISMQAARSLFLPSSRSLLRKATEAWYTILMEVFWDKQRIFEIYLNTVDWGTGLVGAQASAQSYFSRDASQLSRGQAALMAAVLPSPHKWSAKNPSNYIRKRQQRILKQMSHMPLP
jgi:monofunctional glycosyltransferase